MIYINNEKKIEKLKNKMNKKNICMFMDYDKTITTSDSQDSWAASANKEIMGENLSNELDKYYEKYGPIEIDYNIDVKEKEKYMIEWYQKCMDLYYKYNITKTKLRDSINNTNMKLRKGVKEFLYKLYKNDIPVIILSAGIGNTIEQKLENEKCYYGNIDIISNFLKFDEQDKMIKFSGNLIHTLNKDIDKLADINIKNKIEKRDYRIVIGDLIEDINMIGKYKDERTLKIGFLNENIEENIEVYKDNFDIVCTKDSNFFDIENIILGRS